MTIEQLLNHIAFEMTVEFYWKKLWTAHITPTDRWKISAISEADIVKYTLTIFSYDVEKEIYPLTEKEWECLGYLVALLDMLSID